MQLTHQSRPKTLSLTCMGIKQRFQRELVNITHLLQIASHSQLQRLSSSGHSEQSIALHSLQHLAVGHPPNRFNSLHCRLWTCPARGPAQASQTRHMQRSPLQVRTCQLPCSQRPVRLMHTICKTAHMRLHHLTWTSPAPAHPSVSVMQPHMQQATAAMQPPPVLPRAGVIAAPASISCIRPCAAHRPAAGRDQHRASKTAAFPPAPLSLAEHTVACP